MQIIEKYCVGDQCFDTREEAASYIENSADRRMIDAFAEFKRAGGAQRVNTSIIEEYLDFARKQGTEVDSTPPWNEPEPVEAPVAVSEPTEAPVEEEEVETPAPEEEPVQEPVEEPEAAPSKSLFARP